MMQSPTAEKSRRRLMMPPAKKQKTKQIGLWGNKTKEQKDAEEKAAAWEAGCRGTA